MTEDKKKNSPDLENWNKSCDINIRICSWNKCKERLSQYVLERACRELNLNEDSFENWWTTKDWKVNICKTWCMWKCKEWPNIKIEKKWKNWKGEQMISRVDVIKMWNLMNEFKKFKNNK